jgi:hypothetical protein
MRSGSAGSWRLHETPLAPLIAELGDEALDAQRIG